MLHIGNHKFRVYDYFRAESRFWDAMSRSSGMCGTLGRSVDLSVSYDSRQVFNFHLIFGRANLVRGGSSFSGGGFAPSPIHSHTQAREPQPAPASASPTRSLKALVQLRLPAPHNHLFLLFRYWLLLNSKLDRLMSNQVDFEHGLHVSK